MDLSTASFILLIAFRILDFPYLDTSNVENMNRMFYGYMASTIDLSNLNTKNVKDMSSMFENCKFTILDFSSLISSCSLSFNHIFVA